MGLSAISGVEPVFNPAPAIDGRWRAGAARQLSDNANVASNFRLKYVNEKSAWKLIGIKVDAKPAGVAGKLPTNEEAEALVRESLIAFNAAVQTKSFVDFHKGVAVMWQKQVTPDRAGGIVQPVHQSRGRHQRNHASWSRRSTSRRRSTTDGILELKGFVSDEAFDVSCSTSPTSSKAANGSS